jgi:hypothetical protein
VSQPVRVHLEAMSRYAAAMDEVSAGFSNTRRLLIDADVTVDSFGMLPESLDAAVVYEQRTTDALDVLRSGTDVFADMGVAFRQMRDNYRASDENSARRLGAGG